MFKLVGALSAITAGLLAKKAMEEAWRKRRGTDPPINPAGPDTTWGQAIAWTLVSGVGIALARLIAERAAAGAWARRTGHRPPGLERVPAGD